MIRKESNNTQEVLKVAEQELLSAVESDVITVLTEMDNELKEAVDYIAAELAEMDKILNGEVEDD